MNNLIFPPLLPIRVAIKRSIIKQQTHFFSQKLFSISPNGSEKCLCDVDKKERTCQVLFLPLTFSS